jgi:periplasmic divalent cation tolerance protein
MDAVVVFVTAPPDEAEALAGALVESRVAACVNLLPGAHSWFWWEGAIDQAQESLLVIKTTRPRLDALIAAVRERHSYQVFEAVALPITGGYAPYLEWIGASVEAPAAEPEPPR